MCTVQLRFYICVQIAEGITGTAPGDVTRRENKTVQINSGQFMTIKCILLQTFKLKKKKMFVHSFFLLLLLFSMEKIIIIILLTTIENTLTYPGSDQGKLTVTFTRFLSHVCST